MYFFIVIVFVTNKITKLLFENYYYYPIVQNIFLKSFIWKTNIVCKVVLVN